jgi:hypothetical protein
MQPIDRQLQTTLQLVFIKRNLSCNKELSDTMKIGIIIAIVLAAFVVAGLIMFLVWYYVLRKTSSPTVEPTAKPTIVPIKTFQLVSQTTIASAKNLGEWSVYNSQVRAGITVGNKTDGYLFSLNVHNSLVMDGKVAVTDVISAVTYNVGSNSAVLLVHKRVTTNQTKILMFTWDTTNENWIADSDGDSTYSSSTVLHDAVASDLHGTFRIIDKDVERYDGKAEAGKQWSTIMTLPFPSSLLVKQCLKFATDTLGIYAILRQSI